VEHENSKKCSTWNIFNNSVCIIIFSGIIQSVIGIWQFVIQKSIGLTWLKESILSSDISGVAKIVFNGEKYIRAYGLFPHPNILGGFLVLSIISTFAFFKPFNFLENFKKQEDLDIKKILPKLNTNVPRGTLYETEARMEKLDEERHSISKDCPNLTQMFHVEHCMKQKQEWKNLVYYSFLGIQLIALILTFSKSAWIGLIVAILFLWYKEISSQQKCSTWNIVCRWYRTFLRFTSEKTRYFALLGGIIILLVLLVKPDWHSIVGKSITDRMFYLNVSRGTFLENPVLGVGSGQFLLNLKKIENIQDWQFQPVHNVFLLILNELGVVGLGLFIWFIWEVIKNVPRGTFLLTNYLSAIFFGFLVIMLLDHYFWDIQQGQILLWLVLGLISGGKMWTSKKFDTYPQDKAK
jgi:hypothetical protein